MVVGHIGKYMINDIKIKKKYLYFSVIGFIILLVVSFSFGRTYPTTSIIHKLEKEMTLKYNEIINEKNQQIDILNQRLKISQENYNKLSKSLNELKVKYDNIKEPETIREIKDRFIYLGFPPID